VAGVYLRGPIELADARLTSWDQPVGTSGLTVAGNDVGWVQGEFDPLLHNMHGSLNRVWISSLPESMHLGVFPARSSILSTQLISQITPIPILRLSTLHRHPFQVLVAPGQFKLTVDAFTSTTQVGF
jgi:hypothetical protein